MKVISIQYNFYLHWFLNRIVEIGFKIKYVEILEIHIKIKYLKLLVIQSNIKGLDFFFFTFNLQLYIKNFRKTIPV